MKEKTGATTSVLLKSSFWYTASNFLARAMVFITTPLFTRLLTPEENGDFSVFASSQAILLIICGMETYSTINRARFDYRENKEFDAYITSSLVLSSAFTAIVFVVFLLFPNLFFRFFLLDKKYLYLMFAYLFASPALWMFQAKQRIEYKYKLSAAITFFLLIFSSILAVVLALVIKNDRLFGRVFGQYILNVFAGAFFYLSFFRKSSIIRWEYIKYAIRLGLPLVFSYLGAQLLLSMDIFVVKHMSAPETVGFLYIAHSCAQIILIFVQTVNSAWAPWFFDKLKANENDAIQKVFRIYMWFIVFCTAGVLMIGPEIIAVMGGSRYGESLSLLPPTVLCGIFSILTSQFGNLETYRKKTEYAAILTAIAAVINFLLAVAGVKLFGYKAVCYATLISNSILVTMHYLVTRNMGIRSILRAEDMILVIITSLLLIPISLLSYTNLIVRLSILGALVLGAAVYALIRWEQIKAIVIEIRKSKK